MRNVKSGPAEKGSRFCLQRMVESQPEALSDQIVAASSSLLAFGPTKVTWASPLKKDNYLEYRDDFLDVLGLGRFNDELRQFWPRRGPQWDGLAVAVNSEKEKGVILLEAKAHPSESESNSTAGEASRIKIASAIARTQGFMGVPETNWTSSVYQLANRLAFLYFLQEIARVPSWLTLVNFVDDQSYRPTSITDWRNHYSHVLCKMGIRPGLRLMDRVVWVYPMAIL